VLKATRNDGADIYFDLENPNLISQTMINEKVDLFIHAAAANEVECKKEPYKSIVKNVIGTKAALDFCVNNNIENFVYLSTFHVFGDPEGVLNEKSIPFPANDYGLSHLQAEEYVELYRRQNKIKTLILRPSNIYGNPISIQEFKRWTLVPFAFSRDAVMNGKIILNTSGKQHRNFVSAKDICRVIEHALPKMDELSLLHMMGKDFISIRSLAYLIKGIMKENFNENMEVIIHSEDNISAKDYEFTSLYLNEIYQPTDSIEDFIIHFIKQLKGYVKK
jgi:UDP-glucose 4-epimerase